MGKRKSSNIVAGTPDASSLHLCGARSIARTFGVGRSTVTAWKEAGAPILQVGKSYQASYMELWNWLKENRKLVFEQ